MATPVTAVFDIGKTNKKFFLFDKDFKEVYRVYETFPEIEDEDGYPTDDLASIEKFVSEKFQEILESEEYEVTTINCSTYGASFVYLDSRGEVLTPLYNYTKPYPPEILEKFYKAYGNDLAIATETASPKLEMLNSGLQIYLLKHTQPEIYEKVRYALHLPQYISFLFTGIPVSEYTSIGCHTALWDFKKGDYHRWVYEEEIDRILPPIVSTDSAFLLNYQGKQRRFGVGIHDSSAALIPYMKGEKKPFVLISTGTWSICMNPFNTEPLTESELNQDCLSFLRVDGSQVKSSRLFLGNEHKVQVAKLIDYFQKERSYQKAVTFDKSLYKELRPNIQDDILPEDLSIFNSFEEAYHYLMIKLVDMQINSLKLILGSEKIKKIYIDGGFANNDIYVKLLANHFPQYKFRTTQASLGSALGAAMVVSDKDLSGKFLKKNYGLRKHFPFLQINH
ncbi:MAG: carbohydrate kinase [Bacteroidetes bacterium]|nr:carbohydrate kinase [Bacteroidota bacterium]